jgi:chromosome segregation ATPase
MDPAELRSAGIDRGSLDERVDSLATWMSDIEARVRTTELATGDEKAAKELRKAVEALAKHDPKLEKRITDHMAVLADRFETLATTVSHTSAALAARDGEIAALRRELENAGRRIEELGGETGRGIDAREIARLRSMIDAVAAQRPLRASDSRVDELGSRVRLLADRVDSMGATVGAAAATLGRREGDLAILRERLDTGASQIEGLTVELRRLHRDGDLLQQLDALNAALELTNGGLAAREQEAAALRSRIDEAYAQVGSVVTEMQRALGGLANQVAALETLPETTAAALEGRAAELGGRVDAVDRRLEAVSAEVEAGLRDLERRDNDLVSLHAELDAQRAHVDSVVGALRTELEALPDPRARDSEFDARLDELAKTAAHVASRLEQVAADAASNVAASASRAIELEEALEKLSTRLESLDRERDATADQLRRADEVWLEERDWVRRQLERLAAAQAEASEAAGGVEPELGELRSRLDEVEAARDAAASEIVRMSHALDSERVTVQAQLDALAARVADAVAKPGDDSAERIAEVSGRLAELERRDAAAASDLARATAAWTSELGALGARVDGMDAARGPDAESLVQALAARLDASERERAAAASEVAGAAENWAAERASLAERIEDVSAKLARVESAAQSAAAAAAVAAAATPDESVAELRAYVDGLRLKVASSENALAALAGARDAGARLDELARRLEAVELAGAAETWAAERASLSERIEDVSAKLARVESAAHGAAAAAAVGAAGTPDKSVAELRTYVDGLRTYVDGLRLKVASSESELAALAGARDAGARLDELAQRLEAVERAGPGSITILPDSDVPLAGDGRLRLELRALELRMEHAEAAARENREAVLTQLERLASRVELRLQRLENTQDGYTEPVETKAQIVPIRGGAD